MRRSTRLDALALALIVTGWITPPATSAQDDEAPRSSQRVAVLLMSVGDVDPELADSLSEVLIGTVASRGDVTILGREEFQAQLGQGDEGTLECVSSLACLGRVGVQLGVEEVFAGTIARRERTWVFNLNRVEVASGEVLGRVFRELEGDLGAVADALADAIGEVYRPRPLDPPPVSTGAISIACEVDGAEVYLDGTLLGSVSDHGLEHAEIAPGPHELTIEASGFHRWSRSVRVDVAATAHIEARLVAAYDESIHPYVWIGGALGLASLAIAIPLGVSAIQSLDLSLEQRRMGSPTRADAIGFYDAREVEAAVANVLYVVSGLALASAAVMLFFPERTRRGAPERPGVRANGLGIEGWF
ncbi:MAG: PEGA domain-containing protein [Sandaracinaceae bacterium]